MGLVIVVIGVLPKHQHAHAIIGRERQRREDLGRRGKDRMRAGAPRPGTAQAFGNRASRARQPGSAARRAGMAGWPAQSLGSSQKVLHATHARTLQPNRHVGVKVGSGGLRRSRALASNRPHHKLCPTRLEIKRHIRRERAGDGSTGGARASRSADLCLNMAGADQRREICCLGQLLRWPGRTPPQQSISSR